MALLYRNTDNYPNFNGPVIANLGRRGIKINKLVKPLCIGVAKYLVRSEVGASTCPLCKQDRSTQVLALIS